MCNKPVFVSVGGDYIFDKGSISYLCRDAATNSIDVKLKDGRLVPVSLVSPSELSAEWTRLMRVSFHDEKEK